MASANSGPEPSILFDLSDTVQIRFEREQDSLSLWESGQGLELNSEKKSETKERQTVPEAR
jgi:hypothetical protein